MLYLAQVETIESSKVVRAINMKVFTTITLVLCAITAEANPGGQRKTCTVKAGGANTTDDAPAIRAAFRECGRHGRIIFTPTTYHVNSVLDVRGLEDVEIDVRGELLVRYLWC